MSVKRPRCLRRWNSKRFGEPEERTAMKRRRHRKHRGESLFSDKAGLSPGTPVFIGERKQQETQIEVVKFANDYVNVINGAALQDCVPVKDGVTWVNVFGIHDVELIGDLGRRFGIHPLTLEDIVNTSQRPKAEEFDDYFFVVLKMITYHEDSHEINIETVSMVFGAGFVISFQERDGDAFDPIRDRIRTAKGRVRRMGADYLAYALMDAIVDAYFVALEGIGDYIEQVEDEIVLRPEPEHMQEIHRLKREILFLRKSVWPLREEISAILKTESPLIQSETRVYLRDVYDHTIRVVDMVETFRDILSSMHDIYLSSVSNRMNEVMKVLTIIATIFIPLTFVVGVYGMNFEHMPELHWRWSYLGVWGLMMTMTIGMVLYFRKRRWL